MQNEMNDKLLREKLGGYNAPFDENAWAQMDAMLDNRKKRRGFFWLWFSGASVAAVMGAVSLMLLSPKQNSFTGIAGRSVEVSEYVSSNNSALSTTKTAENNIQSQNRNTEDVNDKTRASLETLSSENAHKPSSGSATADGVMENSSTAKGINGGSAIKTSRSAAKRQYKKLIAKSSTSANDKTAEGLKAFGENVAPNNTVREDVLFASINSLPAFLLSNEIAATEI